MTDRKWNINNYFDKIIIVNLDKRKDRWKIIEQRLIEKKITNYLRISAIDITEPPYNSFKLPSNFYDTVGAYGMLCSASLVLQTAKKNKYNRILLLEDDIIFHKNFNKLFENNISQVPNDWYLLYFGTSMHNWRLKNRGIYHKHHFHSKGTIAGAFAVGIDYKIYDLLLSYIKMGNMSWDIGPLSMINKLYLNKCIILSPYLIIADTKDSDIRNGKSIESKANNCNWDLSQFS